MALLAGVIGLIVLAWGWDITANGAGDRSLPWGLREQGLMLRGLLSIATISLAMVLATRTAAWTGFTAHTKWSGILAAVFALAHGLAERSDD